jgi:hypothetical protein
MSIAYVGFCIAKVQIINAEKDGWKYRAKGDFAEINSLKFGTKK